MLLYAVESENMLEVGSSIPLPTTKNYKRFSPIPLFNFYQRAKKVSPMSPYNIQVCGLNPLSWTECVRVFDRILSPERGQKGS